MLVYQRAIAIICGYPQYPDVQYWWNHHNLPYFVAPPQLRLSSQSWRIFEGPQNLRKLMDFPQNTGKTHGCPSKILKNIMVFLFFQCLTRRSCSEPVANRAVSKLRQPLVELVGSAVPWFQLSTSGGMVRMKLFFFCSRWVLSHDTCLPKRWGICWQDLEKKKSKHWNHITMSIVIFSDSAAGFLWGKASGKPRLKWSKPRAPRAAPNTRGKVLHVLEEMQSGGTDIIWYQSIHLENHPFLYLTVKV